MRRLRAAWPAVVVTMAAGAVRLFRLGVPDRLYFDEKYYANDAREYLSQGVEQVRAVHPPVGKWVIAAGVELFGFTPFGWRIAAAVAGTLTVLITYLIAERLIGGRRAAVVAAALVAVDGLAFTMSRIAMLDVFLALFTVLGLHLVLVDRDRRATGRLGGPWLVLAGVAFGLAVGTKLAGATAIAAAAVWYLFLAVRPAGLATGPGRRRVLGVLGLAARRLPAVVVCLGVVPGIVYVASYAGWLSNAERTATARRLCRVEACPEGVTGAFSAWWNEQGEILRFHRDLVPRHPYRSAAIGWPYVSRPVLYYFERCDPGGPAPDARCAVGPGQRAKILGVGNPAVWWPALAAYAVLGWQVVRRRDRVAATILLFLLALWLPWVLSPKTGFFFYLTPAVPFIALALAYAAERARSVRLLRPLPAVLVVVAVGTFAFFYPVYAAVEGPKAELDRRIWFEAWR